VLSDHMFECRCFCCSHTKSGPKSGFFTVFSFAVSQFNQYFAIAIIVKIGYSRCCFYQLCCLHIIAAFVVSHFCWNIFDIPTCMRKLQTISL
jgi:hypothetical protein